MYLRLWRMVLVVVGISTMLPLQAFADYVASPQGQRRLIVFVHGLGNSGGDDARMAWSGTTPENNWPAVMNSDPAFSRNFAIYIAQYDTSHYSGNFHIRGLSDELGRILNDEVKKYDEVFFVAHSLGGIVVRNLLIRDEAIRTKTRAIFLFASPMGGSSIAGVADALGIAGMQTAQLGDSPDDPDAVFNTLKDDWFREVRNIPSFCAYETEKTSGVIVVTRSSVEPLCSNDVKPLRGAHTPIVQPPKTGQFHAQGLLKGWMSTVLPDFEEAALADEKENQVVVANCSANEAYKGPYGSVHSLLKDLLQDNGVKGVRYSLPISQTWSGDSAKGQFFKTQVPTDIVIHLSCFQNAKGDTNQSVRTRDRHFIAFLKSFKNERTNIIVYSRAFTRNKCNFLVEKIKANDLEAAFKDRLKLIPVKEGEMPGDTSSANDTIVAATSTKKDRWETSVDPDGCFRPKSP